MDFKKCPNFEKNVRFFVSQIWFYLLKSTLKDTKCKKRKLKTRNRIYLAS
ncbi:DNA methylase [Helicobacter pylori]|nr:DNA methylase [Helicobacter pylori]MUU18685.1 DNA methylase [Helicobacter pylori]MUU33370.1 DNA methylase [Helicobacter pylori]MUU36285.1 DNA methylase [Helicobacter pylori]MUU47020.1 DNA methylase [Helicobacter pylori]